jgi:predicted signal transduction protein with EAL and GGDEF domain
MFAPGQMIHGGKAGSTHQAYPSIDDLGAEWPSFAESADFPFFEVKVDRKFITGCADDRLKQMICRRILHLADIVGARTVAKGVETRADFLCVREMGFKLPYPVDWAEPIMPCHWALITTCAASYPTID